MDLERKDQALLRLESQMIELSEMLKVISEKNDIISNTNNQLMQYINSENQKKLKYKTTHYAPKRSIWITFNYWGNQ